RRESATTGRGCGGRRRPAADAGRRRPAAAAPPPLLRRLSAPGPRSLPWFLAAAAEDRFQHLVGIVAIDHRAQELAHGFHASRIDTSDGPVDAIGLQAG